MGKDISAGSVIAEGSDRGVGSGVRSGVWSGVVLGVVSGVVSGEVSGVVSGEVLSMVIGVGKLRWNGNGVGSVGARILVRGVGSPGVRAKSANGKRWLRGVGNSPRGVGTIYKSGISFRLTRKLIG